MNKGLLYKTKWTVIGPMEFADGQPVREYISQHLAPLGITIFNHYKKPFITQFPEDEDARQQLKNWVQNEEYDKVANWRAIRTYDLNLIDRSDAIIFDYYPSVMTVGSFEELFWSNRLKKPIFFITNGGKKLTPLWIFWTIPHKYIYDSADAVIEMVKKLDSGEIKMDSDRWRLLDVKYR